MKARAFFGLGSLLVFTFVACGDDAITDGVWTAQGGQGFAFTFTVADGGTTITEIAFDWSDWTCGGAMRSGAIIVSKDPGWAVSSSSIDISTTAGPGESIEIAGAFENGTTAAGTWTADMQGSTCSGSWTATAP